MSRSEMANYMAGMLEQWQKEDADLLKKRKAAAAQSSQEQPNKQEEEEREEAEALEDDDDDDYEDCDDMDEGVIKDQDHLASNQIEYLDEDEELLEECEFSSQDFNMAFVQAMNDHKQAYPNGWQ